MVINNSIHTYVCNQIYKLIKIILQMYFIINNY